MSGNNSGPSSGPPLDEYEKAALLRRVLQEFTRESERVMRRHGLTTERYQLLLALKIAARRGQLLTVRDLAAALHIAPSSATQLIRRAENLGLLGREHSERDARIRYLKLTEEGERRLAAAVEALREDREHLVHQLST